MYDEIKSQARAAMQELLELAAPRPGSLVVVGCSSSEIMGSRIGKGSTPEAAEAVVEAIYPLIEERGLYLAAQCCEHLNRAVILEEEAARKRGYEQVNVVPFPKAGGSFATAAYNAFKSPFAAESIRADAGIDIGGTLIGMHLKQVAVPVRISQKTIGAANVICARTRPKLIGGERAHYDDELMK